MKKFQPTALPEIRKPNDEVTEKNFRLLAQALASLQAAVAALQGASGGGATHGSGTAGFIPIWETRNRLADSLMEQVGSTIQMAGTMMPTQGAMHSRLITQDLTIPTDYVLQMAGDLEVSVGVTVEVEADGLWFVDN